MKTITDRFRELGFQVGVSHQVFVKDLSKNTSLIVEGERKQGYVTYRYMFYKVTYYPRGKDEKVYMENASPRRVLHRVASFIYWLEKER
ncbi:hypothetical protein EPH95_15925 [Salicibibacter halophilus]|uniref:Uncharacterized protein n=1 Tax=Salicibibacter halophilus TaxID=2502791 RepID=A0A514LKU9_9BACI|nr:hypothetical protein [Salicibibacter halophilus]QDI92494.1 hypothetical protein EPH95_15925 [Salicibibacter halophilus]